MPDGISGVPPKAGMENALGLGATHLDVLIIGAGLSGIGAACRIAKKSRHSTFAILEARDVIGGTWDLFRYPGVRSDSDMYTLGYSFRPWRGLKALAPAGAILDYIRQTAAQYGIERHIRFGHRLVHAAWSSEAAQWALDVEIVASGQVVRYTAGMLLMCGGYYSYAQGHAPEFAGAADFEGKIVHPQFWPEGLDYAGKKMVVIGSGATAVTLVPSLAQTASHVVMLQRSPSYVVSRPSVDRLAARLHRFLPGAVAANIVRAKNIIETIFLYTLARRKPAEVKRAIVGLVRKELGTDYDVERHFTPSYKPWDQRVCLVPDADLFKAISSGKASVVTEHIETLTRMGIKLRDGREIAADIIVSATGLKLQMMGGATIAVDGTPLNVGATLTYKGMMLAGVPNFVFVVGYTNASWTLKADLVSNYTVRLLNFMKRRGFNVVVPTRDPAVREAPIIDFSSGYVQRAAGQLPQQGDRKPWLLHQNYLRDMPMLRFGRLRDGVLKFRRVKPALPMDVTL